MNDEKVGDVLFPAFAGSVAAFVPVDEIKSNCTKHKVAKNDDVNRQNHIMQKSKSFQK